MKGVLKILILFFFINTSLLVVHEKANAQTIGFQVFYDDLSPHGRWIESPEYGYVWSPHVSGFTPYSTNGYWVLTDYGWTWVSGYSWGWAPFHYGRWYYDSFYGYVWVPGYEWGPGWVTWRRSNDYYGWAPIGPGVSINLAYSSGYNIPYNRWNFVRCNDFGRRDIHNYYVDRSKNVTIINNTTVINNTKVDNTRKVTFNTGPDRMEVQRKSGRAVNPVAVVDEKTPTQRVSKNSVQLYRPVVKNDAANNDGKKPMPANITPQRDVKARAKDLTKRDLPDVKQENNKKAEHDQPARQMQDDRKNSQIKKTPVREHPGNDNPVRREEKNDVIPPVRQQPERNPVRDEVAQPERDKVRQQQENRQPDKTPVQRQQDNQRNVNEPVRQDPDRQKANQQQQQREQPRQNMERPQQQREQPRQNIDRPQPQQREQPRQNMDRPQQRQMERPARQPQARPHPSHSGNANSPSR